MEGETRRGLAACNATSGAISKTFKPELSDGAGNFATVLAMDVSPDGDTLYVAGDFALVNGASRRNAAAVSTGIATLRAWSPASSADIVGDLVLSPSGRTVFVGGRSAGGYVQAYGPTAGGAPVWNVAANGDVEALAIGSSTLYVGGHFTAVGGSDRGHLAALTASGGCSAGTPAPTASSGPPSPAAASPSGASSPRSPAMPARGSCSSPGPPSQLSKFHYSGGHAQWAGPHPHALEEPCSLRSDGSSFATRSGSSWPGW